MFPGASRRPTEYSAASSSCSFPGFDAPPPLNVFLFQVVDLVSTDDKAKPTSSDGLVRKESVDCSLDSYVEAMDEPSLGPGCVWVLDTVAPNQELG